MAMSSVAAVSAEEKSLELTVNDAVLEISAFEENGQVMVPVRAVCEALDMEVVWNDEAKRVEITKLPHYVTFTPFEDGYTFARTAPIMLGTAPQLLGEGVTYVPAEFFGEIIPSECEISETGVEITYGEQAEAEQSADRNVLITGNEEGKLTVYDPMQGEVIVNITEETKITDEEGADASAEILAAGKLVKIEYAPAMTLSLPPIANAVSITVLAGDYELVQTEVTGFEENGILVSLNEETVLVKAEDFFALDAEGNEIEELSEGDKITAIVSMASTFSIPPQRNVSFIRIVE